MNFLLLASFGSSGDVNPFVGIGAALKARGHSVRLVTNPYHENSVRRAGLDFTPIGSRQDFETALHHPDVVHRRRGLRFVIRLGMIRTLRESYEVTREFMLSGPGMVVTSGWALGARMAQEKFGLSLVTVHLQPQILFSLHETPVYPQSDISHWPHWAKRLAFKTGDILMDRMIAPEFNQFRQEVGLPPIYRIFRDWMHSPQLTIGFWPEWFGPTQPDWPAQIRLTGFPLYDATDTEDEPAGLEEFLNDGPPPVLFTFGTSMRQAKHFFEVSVEACRKTGCRGLLVTKFPDQIPANLPASVRHFSYVPFSRVLGRLMAFVNHAGIGSIAQALSAGVPQITMPIAHDQPDNAARAERLGVSITILPDRYKVGTVTSALNRIASEPAYRQNAEAIKERFHGMNAFEHTCDLLEKMACAEAVV